MLVHTQHTNTFYLTSYKLLISIIIPSLIYLFIYVSRKFSAQTYSPLPSSYLTYFGITLMCKRPNIVRKRGNKSEH